MKRKNADFVGPNSRPRVRITYRPDGPRTKKGLNIPFVVGVLADLSGKGADDLPRLEDREFREVDLHGFDDLFRSARPRIAFEVDSPLTDGGKLGVDINFESLRDFSPAAVTRMVEPIRKLLETRAELNDLVESLESRGKAKELLEEILANKTLLKSLQKSVRLGEGRRASGRDPRGTDSS